MNCENLRHEKKDCQTALFLPLSFFIFSVYYHGNPGLLRESILLPDSTIFAPIAILSAASKNTKKRGPPPTVMNPTKPKKP